MDYLMIALGKSRVMSNLNACESGFFLSSNMSYLGISPLLDKNEVAMTDNGLLTVEKTAYMYDCGEPVQIPEFLAAYTTNFITTSI